MQWHYGHGYFSPCWGFQLGQQPLLHSIQGMQQKIFPISQMKFKKKQSSDKGQQHWYSIECGCISIGQRAHVFPQSPQHTQRIAPWAWIVFDQQQVGDMSCCWRHTPMNSLSPYAPRRCQSCSSIEDNYLVCTWILRDRLSAAVAVERELADHRARSRSCFRNPRESVPYFRTCTRTYSQHDCEMQSMSLASH